MCECVCMNNLIIDIGAEYFAAVFRHFVMVFISFCCSRNCAVVLLLIDVCACVANFSVHLVITQHSMASSRVMSLERSTAIAKAATDFLCSAFAMHLLCSAFCFSLFRYQF